MRFLVTLTPGEDGQVVAECPMLPGCISQGYTRDEALANIEEAIQGYVASLRKRGEAIPQSDIEEIEVAV